MNYVYQAVDRVPGDMSEGVVYHSEEFELAGLLCACGCGHRVVLLVPDSHRVWAQEGMASVWPSIGVFDAPCKSHYVITAGEVQWLPAFSGVEATSIMRTQIARHVAKAPKPRSWINELTEPLGWAVAKISGLTEPLGRAAAKLKAWFVWRG